jgi:hypothetical protein
MHVVSSFQLVLLVMQIAFANANRGSGQEVVEVEDWEPAKENRNKYLAQLYANHMPGLTT